MSKPERKDLDWKERSALAVAGALTVIYGYGQILRGKLIYTNWRGLDISAQVRHVSGIAISAGCNFPLEPHPLPMGERPEKAPSLVIIR